MRRWLKKNLKYLFVVISLGFPFSTAGFKSHALDSEMLIAYPRYQECRFGHCAMDMGILNPATGEISRLNVGLITAPEFIQGSHSGFVFYHQFDGTYVIKVDGSEHYFIPNVNALDWSPDGQQILGLEFQAEFDVKLVITDLEGRNRIELANNLAGFWAAWSPDGQQIALAKSAENESSSEIFIVNADGTNLQQLTYDEIDDGFPQWSPNGEYIAVNTDNGTDLIDLKNDAERIVLGLEGAIRWVNDDQVIQQIPSDQEGLYDLVLTNIWGQASEVLVTGPRVAGIFVSPDGRQVAYAKPNADNRAIGNVCVYDFETRTETCFEQVNAYCCGGTVWVGKP